MDITRYEKWFSSDHIHDTATIILDAPLFVGELFIDVFP